MRQFISIFIKIFLNYIFLNLGKTRSEILTVSIKALANYTYEIHSLFLFKKSDFFYVFPYVLSNMLILHRFIALLVIKSFVKIPTVFSLTYKIHIKSIRSRILRHLKFHCGGKRVNQFLAHCAYGFATFCLKQ